ncbi:MAG: response regulator [Opitutales bacterium]
MAGKILVLDDEENYAVMLKDLLCDHNYQVDVATRPERALSQIEEIPYDLIISDYKMPVMDGSDFLKKARELYPNLPFILVSGLMNTPELVKVANMSVTLVMEKPLDTEAFLKHVARFSEPMTEEEKAAMGESSAAAPSASPGYPEEPCFVSAESSATKQLLRQVWALAQSGQTLYLVDPAAGESDLVAKDLSRWRGNEDLQPAFLKMPGTSEQGVAEIRSVIADPDRSDTIFLRMDSETPLSHAEALADRVFREVEGAEAVLLVFALPAEPDPAKIPDSIRERVVVLPSLSSRPLEIASYVSRFLKLANERVGRDGQAVLSPEAVYRILSFDWQKGYRQIKSVLTHAAEATEADETISLEVIDELLGVEDPVPAAPERLKLLMQRAQSDFLRDQMRREKLDPAELAKEFELGRSIRTEADLARVPLVREDLASL